MKEGMTVKRFVGGNKDFRFTHNPWRKQVSMLERLNVCERVHDSVRDSVMESRNDCGRKGQVWPSKLKKLEVKEKNKINKINIYPTVKIKLLNSQGFDEAKYQELESKYLIDKVLHDMKEYNLICLTETQERVEKVKKNDAVFRHLIMRQIDDKKGGGLKVFGRVDSRVRLDMVQRVKSRDVLALEGVIFGLQLRLILVYFDCTKITSGDGYKRKSYRKRGRKSAEE